MEGIFKYIYLFEMIIKIVGMGFLFNKGAYLRSSWNILDFVIVLTAFLPDVQRLIGAEPNTESTSSSQDSSFKLSSLRSLRVLRPLKTISKSRDLKVLLLALFSAVPMLRNTIFILFFFFLIFAIAGV